MPNAIHKSICFWVSLPDVFSFLVLGFACLGYGTWTNILTVNNLATYVLCSHGKQLFYCISRKVTGEIATWSTSWTNTKVSSSCVHSTLMVGNLHSCVRFFLVRLQFVLRSSVKFDDTFQGTFIWLYPVHQREQYWWYGGGGITVTSGA